MDLESLRQTSLLQGFVGRVPRLHCVGFDCECAAIDWTVPDLVVPTALPHTMTARSQQASDHVSFVVSHSIEAEMLYCSRSKEGVFFLKLAIIAMIARPH